MPRMSPGGDESSSIVFFLDKTQINKKLTIGHFVSIATMIEPNYRRILAVFGIGLGLFVGGIFYLPQPNNVVPEGITVEEYSKYQTSIVIASTAFKIAMTGVSICVSVIIYLCIPHIYDACHPHRIQPEVLPQIQRRESIQHLKPILKITPPLAPLPPLSSSPPAQLVASVV